MNTRNPTRVAFISPCGYGNLGDAAIQDAFISGMTRALGPGAEFVGITQNPPDTEERHGVRAVPMDVDAFRLRRRHAPPAGSASEAGTGVDSPPRRHPLVAAAGAATRLLKEVLHWRIALREMRDADLLVVSGGGQLDDHWGGHWRVPYALYKWTLAAKLHRKDVLVMSVGAGTTDSRLTRFFLRSALSRAGYASFRDERTLQRVHTQRLSSSTVVVPDLAFGYDRPEAPADARDRDRVTVALSPIAFLDPVAWPRKDQAAYAVYVARTAGLVRRLVERGLDVVLCTSDTPDVKTATEVLDAYVEDAPAELVSRVRLANTSSLPALLECFRSADLAIASRLHGLILANVMGTPTIALSYDWKVDEHMKAMELERYVFPIATFSADEVVRAVDDVVADRPAVATAVARVRDRLAREVAAQYETALRCLDAGLSERRVGRAPHPGRPSS